MKTIAHRLLGVAGVSSGAGSTKTKRKRGASKPSESKPRFFPFVNLAQTLKVAGLLVLLAVFGGLVSQVPSYLNRFPLEEIEVDGVLQFVDRVALKQVVLKHTDLEKNRNYFSIDLVELQEEVQQLPWVEAAEVRKYWPNVLRVTIEERVAIAIWDDNQLISHKGDLFKPKRMIESSDLPRLYGSQTKARFVMENYHEMSKVLRSTQLRITELRLAERMAWTLKLSNEIEVIIDKSQSVEKLLRFVDLYEQLQQRNVDGDTVKIARVDLRYSNGIAIRWAEAG